MKWGRLWQDRGEVSSSVISSFDFIIYFHHLLTCRSIYTPLLGGYGDYTDNAVRNIHLVESLHPPLIMNGVSTNSFDSGSDIIHGNEKRDIIFGSGGALGEFCCKRFQDPQPFCFLTMYTIGHSFNF